jgi:RNA polymerase sigma-70 factor (ECF subfamily)
LFATFQAGYQALGQLLEQHREYLLKIINEEIDQRLEPRQGASDIEQNAFLNIIANLQRSTGGIFAVSADEDLRKWLRRVCLNALYKENRDEGREQRDFRRDQPVPDGFDQQAAGPSPSSIYCQRERDELLGQAVNALPEADRMLLRLREWHDWTYAALAQLLDGDASEAGRVRVQRRLAELYFQLGEDGPIQELQD